MDSDTILRKYMRHLRFMNGGYVSLDAVELAFRLAIEELEESTAPANTVAELGAANLRIMELQADVERLTDALRISQHGTALVIKNPPFSEGPADNLQSPNPPISNLPPNPPPAPLPLDLSSLAPDELDQVVAVQSGENTWRTLPKDLRKKVILLTLRQLAKQKGSRIDTKQWDELRPPWMPGNNAIALTLQCKWSEIPQE